MPEVKHIPSRTCIGCGQERFKLELIRVVRTPNGSFEIDVTGKLAGRGAYLCFSPACWELGIKKGKLEHALKGKITPSDYQVILDYSKKLKGAD